MLVGQEAQACAPAGNVSEGKHLDHQAGICCEQPRVECRLPGDQPIRHCLPHQPWVAKHSQRLQGAGKGQARGEAQLLPHAGTTSRTAQSRRSAELSTRTLSSCHPLWLPGLACLELPFPPTICALTSLGCAANAAASERAQVVERTVAISGSARRAPSWRAQCSVRNTCRYG